MSREENTMRSAFHLAALLTLTLGASTSAGQSVTPPADESLTGMSEARPTIYLKKQYIYAFLVVYEMALREFYLINSCSIYALATVA